MHHDEAVALLADPDGGLVGLTHPAFAFVRERHRREGEHRGARLGGQAGDRRGGAAAGAATEAGHEDDDRHAGEEPTQSRLLRFGGSQAKGCLTARAHPARLRTTELQAGAGSAGGQGARIGVQQRDGDLGRKLRREPGDHGAARAAEADEEDGGGRGHLRSGRAH